MDIAYTNYAKQSDDADCPTAATETSENSLGNGEWPHLHPADVAGALAKRGCVDDATIGALNPWRAMDFRWKEKGVTRAEVARQLTAAGAMDPISEQELDAVQHKNGESLVLSLLTHGGESRLRLAHCAMRSDEFNPRHDDLFAQLIRITRPPLQVESISQTLHVVETVQEAKSAHLSMWQDGEWKPTPEHLLGDMQLVSLEESKCTVRYVYGAREYTFDVRSSGSLMNVWGVLRAFNGFMRQLGHEERAFRLKGPGGDDSWALFLCANDAAFRQVAMQLHIPLLQEE